MNYGGHDLAKSKYQKNHNPPSKDWLDKYFGNAFFLKILSLQI